MNITFYGAAQNVTGSCHMVEVAGHKFLIDCGLFQGSLTNQMMNYEDFPFNIQEVEFVILTLLKIGTILSTVACLICLI